MVNCISYLYLRFITLYSKYVLEDLDDKSFEEMINRYIDYKRAGGKRKNKEIESILKTKDINYVCN